MVKVYIYSAFYICITLVTRESLLQSALSCCTYRDNVSFKSVGWVSTLYHSAELWITHSCFDPCCAHRTCKTVHVKTTFFCLCSLLRVELKSRRGSTCTLRAEVYTVKYTYTPEHKRNFTPSSWIVNSSKQYVSDFCQSLNSDLVHLCWCSMWGLCRCALI